MRREFLRRLNEIPGVSIPEDAITRRPSIPLALFAADPKALEALKAALDWFCETVRSDAKITPRTSAHMTMREAEEFIASVPWRAVKMVEVGDTGKTPDPHEYVIKGWREVDSNLFDAFVRLIKAEGYRARYRAPYRPDYVMTNRYLEINGWCYWFIYPNMLNRERAEDRKHQPIPD